MRETGMRSPVCGVWRERTFVDQRAERGVGLEHDLGLGTVAAREKPAGRSQLRGTQGQSPHTMVGLGKPRTRCREWGGHATGRGTGHATGHATGHMRQGMCDRACDRAYATGHNYATGHMQQGICNRACDRAYATGHNYATGHMQQGSGRAAGGRHLSISDCSQYGLCSTCPRTP